MRFNPQSILHFTEEGAEGHTAQRLSWKRHPARVLLNSRSPFSEPEDFGGYRFALEKSAAGNRTAQICSRQRVTSRDGGENLRAPHLRNNSDMVQPSLTL